MPAHHGRALGAVLFALCLGAASAHGQVLRCTDARTGAVTYTDGSCDSGRQAEQVLPARSPEALAREREEAAQAIARKEQRLREEAAAAALAPAPAAPAAPVSPAESARCADSRQQLQDLLNRPGRATSPAYAEQRAAARQQMELDCLGPKAYGELEQSRAQSAVPSAPVIIVQPPRPQRPLPPQVQPPRPQITHCNVFRCYDRNGNIYPR
ncbi:DUF4124 domain-containing protein [Acidovorax sp. CCYZU-2555]|uniref:DUF4124 domain-containing protein n=1 Tax=Acidovorax sp. CCYZU-2555 TaxID=2835042 RepID=UPI001BCEA412|nr:DUF4124 domain-containing protein [Acidovorax sp. CCYZU-2555]MBS7778449.1 DUF4124 domain-containing protein [Acidovorax sp. CCYZU-2555]